MKTLAKVFEKHGHKASVSKDRIEIKVLDESVFVEVSEEWKDFLVKNSSGEKFNFEDKVYQKDNFVEMQVTCLDENIFHRFSSTFVDSDGSEIEVDRATDQFAYSVIKSEDFKETFNRRLNSLIKRKKRRNSDEEIVLTVDELLPRPMTLSYTSETERDNLLEYAKKKAKSCLFKYAHYGKGCWELVYNLKPVDKEPSYTKDDMDDKIPFASYKDDLVAYYKMAMSSRYSSQAFLSYYHILEYFFLRVSEEDLVIRAKTIINAASFSTNDESVTKLIDAIKSSDVQHDETEMLRLVLRKYVDEEGLIELIKNVETNNGEKLYTKPKGMVFGERLNIRAEPGHALSNVAKVIKHIRNALVHSTDRYSRNDCYLPFSESDKYVVNYLPLIRYVSEQVIFATAEN
ncbi:hypothetical protein ACPV33_23880 [Vibrio harveyi]|uniref:hypothetical protein n=1 Tax=Vibrio harveyi TaxID=669 RepID=UPI0040675D73